MSCGPTVDECFIFSSSALRTPYTATSEACRNDLYDISLGPRWMNASFSQSHLPGTPCKATNSTCLDVLKNSLHTCTANTASVVIVMSGNLIGMPCWLAVDVCVIHVSTHCKEPIAKIGNKYYQKRNCDSHSPISKFMCL
jgi:hypothetical protein